MDSKARVRNVCALVAVTALAGLLMLAAIASGGERLKTKSQTTQIDPQDDGSATAKCKRGTKAVSGGFSSELDLANPALILPYASLRQGGRGWRSSGLYLSGAQESDFTSYAYCRDEQLKKNSKSVTVDGSAPPDYGTGSATAKCPKGTTIVSGGFDNPDFDVDFSGMGQTGLIGYESRRQGKRKWTASALNLGDDSGELRVQANCREGEKLKTKQRSEEIDATGGAELAEVTARCAKKQRVISGGFSSSDPIDAGGSELALVYGSRKQGKRQWTVSAVLTGEETITAYAYCEA
jgi:hypothetical protein